MTINGGTLLGEIPCRLGETNAAPPLVDPVEHVVEGWLVGETGELAGGLLLERLAALLSALSHLGVDIVGDVSYEYVRHVFVMLASGRGRIAPEAL